LTPNVADPQRRRHAARAFVTDAFRAVLTRRWVGAQLQLRKYLLFLSVILVLGDQIFSSMDLSFSSRATGSTASSGAGRVSDDYGLDFHSLPRGVLPGVVDLWDSDGGDWYLRNPRRFRQPLESMKKPQPIWFWAF